MRSQLRCISIFMLFVLFCYADCLHACTLWAVAGEKVQGGGVLFAKNRDRIPQKSELEMIIPEKGFTYFGLFSVVKGKKGGLVAGINEKGLSVASATAGSIRKKERGIGMERINEEMLRLYDTADAVLKNQSLFKKSRPAFYMIADRTTAAVIEVAPNGEVSIKTQANGILFHTNHYTSEVFLHFNKKVSQSSEKRLSRIQSMLERQAGAFTIDDFVAFSEDSSDGPDNSIWRTGSAPHRERTIATWIVYIPKKGAPEIFLKVANPGEEAWIMNTILDRPFWTEGIAE